jgi:hypothetical protein
LLFETNHGAIGTLAVSQSRPPDGGSMVVSFDGVEETIMFHEGRPDLLDVMGPRATERFQRGVGAEVSRYSTQRAGRPQGHRDCWSSFVADAHAAARGRTPEGLPTLADLARSAQLGAAVRDASATAAWAPVTRNESEVPTIMEGTTA